MEFLAPLTQLLRIERRMKRKDSPQINKANRLGNQILHETSLNEEAQQIDRDERGCQNFKQKSFRLSFLTYISTLKVFVIL